MTEPTPGPTPTPYGEMAQRVLELLKRHPLLQPLRDAGERVLVSCHEEALWVHGLPRGAQGYAWEARISAPRWWDPRGEAPEVWARKLAARLARLGRAAWEGRERAT